MKSINQKMMIWLGLMVVLISVGMGTTAYVTSSTAIHNILEETMPKFAKQASSSIQDRIQLQFTILRMFLTEDEVTAYIRSGDPAVVRAKMAAEVEYSGYKRMMFVDLHGKALHHTGETSDMKGDPYFEQALLGNTVVSDPMFDRDGRSVIMTYAVPIRANQDIIGVLIAVRDGLELSAFAQSIQYGKTGEAFIINSQGKTIAHADIDLMRQIIQVGSVDGTASATVKASAATDQPAEPSDSSSDVPLAKTDLYSQLGFKGFAKLQQRLMAGDEGFDEYEYNGTVKVAGFAPIDGHGWSVAVSADKDELLAGLSDLKTAAFRIAFLFLLTGFGVAFVIGKGFSRPIVYLTKQCRVMSEGDFTAKMDERYMKRRDEIGNLARGFHKINENVSIIVRNVVAEANRVNEAIRIVNQSIHALTQEMNTITALTQELSSGIQETSAMAEEMNATSIEIEAAIDSIAHRANEGAEYASEVSRRAHNLKLNAKDSSELARQLQATIHEQMKKALEDSKSVEQIGILSDAIRNISSQTNLLALNATIEAAHAGDKGRGFAVVASEIRKLADHSNQIVSEIQEVTNRVIQSVQQLAESAFKSMEFLDTKVVNDYDQLVETGEQYDHDAQMVDGIVTEFSATSQQLYASVQSMTKAISEVASAANKGAIETADMANKATEVASFAEEVLKQAQAVDESSHRLLQLVSAFKAN